MPKPIDPVAAGHRPISSSPDVKENRRSPLGIVKDFTHAAGAKATEVMRDVALSIARKIDVIWDRISPSCARAVVKSMASPVPTRKEVVALVLLRSEISELGREKDKEVEMESKIQEYDALLEKMGGSEGDFYKRVDEFGALAMERCRKEELQKAAEEDGKVGYASGHSMDFELEGLKAVLENLYPTIEADKPTIDDPLSIDDDFWNWNDPTQSIAKEKTLRSGFEFLRENIKEEGMWRVSGSASSKKQNLEKIDKGIAPTFTDVNQATDVLKVLIGTTNDDYISPYLNHSLSLEKFMDLSEKAEKEKLTLDTMNEALKAAFGGDRKKLAMFKQLLVLLKETSQHADDNKMTVENLVICLLNGLLQRYFKTEAGDAARNYHLGTFLINNADAILADI
ncbi:MAG: hypothetical protein JSR39_06640 [Verrucomicrobia bacterium]|nr:hypothetical protein [Verrucomicrobiota bacterium]